MSTFVFTNGFISIDGNDLSDHMMSGALNYEADAVEDTNMGDDTHLNLGGLKNYSVEVEFSQDFAASEVDAVLFPLVGTAITVIIRPDAGAASATNPSYTASMVLTSYNPIGGSVGDKATTSCSFVPAATLTRVTS